MNKTAAYRMAWRIAQIRAEMERAEQRLASGAIDEREYSRIIEKLNTSMDELQKGKT